MLGLGGLGVKKTGGAVLFAICFELSCFKFFDIHLVIIAFPVLKIIQLVVSVLHQNEEGIGISIPDVQEISQDTRDFPRAKTKGNFEGHVGGARIQCRTSIQVKGDDD